ncbi:NTPase [bacterium]|nr:NTPase [candidate division CSSED10-310 bacterium]
MTQKFKNVLLTGEPGIGKTTVIQAVLADFNLDAGGFFTQEIRSGKTRKGFQLITLDGQQAILAHINKKSSYKVGKYGVDLNVMADIAVPAIKKALQNCDLVLIDEIGKMECFCIEFRDMVMRCLDGPKPLFGSIQNFASPFINAITNRDDIVRIMVTEENRNHLPGNIIELFRRIIPSKPSKNPKKKF